MFQLKCFATPCIDEQVARKRVRIVQLFRLIPFWSSLNKEESLSNDSTERVGFKKSIIPSLKTMVPPPCSSTTRIRIATRPRVPEFLFVNLSEASENSRANPLLRSKTVLVSEEVKQALRAYRYRRTERYGACAGHFVKVFRRRCDVCESSACRV